MINDYPAPLDTLRVLVRAGTIVPMFPAETTVWAQGKQSGRLDLDIYPPGESCFISYEDDGRTRARRASEVATQQFDVRAPCSWQRNTAASREHGSRRPRGPGVRQRCPNSALDGRREIAGQGRDLDTGAARSGRRPRDRLPKRAVDRSRYPTVTQR